MIDTVKFKININPDDYERYVIEAEQTTKKDRKTGEIKYNVHNKIIEVGSHDRDLKLYFPSSRDVIHMELSYPKFIYNSNVEYICMSEFLATTEKLYLELLKHFKYFPHYKNWKVQRLDVCYNWKYETDQLAQNALSILQRLDYPRKRKFLYDTSVNYIGKAYTVKFYLKHPEYKVHDYRALRNYDFETAQKYLKESIGILRYEVTLKKAQLQSLTGLREPQIDDILQLSPREILKNYLEKMLHYYNPENINEDNASLKLFNRYKPTKAIRLYNAYKDLMSKNPSDKERMKTTYSRTQLHNIKSDIKKAGVGLEFKDIELKDFKLNLEIKPCKSNKNLNT